jgi:hypothetical protein
MPDGDKYRRFAEECMRLDEARPETPLRFELTINPEQSPFEVAAPTIAAV